MKTIIRSSAFFLLSLVLTVACQKDFENTPKRTFEKTNTENPVGAPVLKFSSGLLKNTLGNIITSGDAISVNSSYYSSFWLEPAEGIVATGDWEISNDSGAIVFQKSNANGIDVVLSPGNYTLRVSGSYQGEYFLYNNIKINSQDANSAEIEPPTPTPEKTLTSPVNLSNLRVVGNKVFVTITISKEEYYGTTDWFYLRRINGRDFTTKQPVTETADSVSFVMECSKTNGTVVDFNAAYNDGGPGVWITASTSGSILYAGGENYFSYKVKIVGGDVELVTNTSAEIVLISTSGKTTAPAIPGEAGDEVGNDFTVRWSGLKHFIKTEVVNPSVAYKVGVGGSWTFVQLTESSSPGYWEFNLPQDSKGTVYLYWGSGTNAINFVPATSEMIKSMYYSADDQICAKNI